MNKNQLALLAAERALLRALIAIQKTELDTDLNFSTSVSNILRNNRAKLDEMIGELESEITLLEKRQDE